MNGHYIEEIAKVYLRLDADGNWMIDAATLDGSPLFGYDGGPIDDECQCDLVDGHWGGGHRAVLEHAQQAIDLPTAEELFDLLGRALGKEGF